MKPVQQLIDELKTSCVDADERQSDDAFMYVDGDEGGFGPIGTRVKLGPGVMGTVHGYYVEGGQTVFRFNKKTLRHAIALLENGSRNNAAAA